MTEHKCLVLDANILLRVFFGIRVRALLETYEDSVNFYTPDICFTDARNYISRNIAMARRVDPVTGLLVLNQLARLVEIVDESLYEERKSSAWERMLSRDVEDSLSVATCLLLDCPVWTEDQDFFGSGIATWTTKNVEIYLRDG